jgi:hypothetical protein
MRGKKLGMHLSRYTRHREAPKLNDIKNEGSDSLAVGIMLGMFVSQLHYS